MVRYILILFLLFCVNKLNSQNINSDKISVYYVLQKTFDLSGGDFVQKNGISLGIKYSHNFAKAKFGLNASYTHVNSIFSSLNQNLRYDIFTLSERNSHLLTFGIDKRIFKIKSLNISLNADVNFRYGMDLFLKRDLYYFDNRVNIFTYKDFGLGFGTDFNYYITNNISIDLGVNYKYFLFGDNKGDYSSIDISTFYNPNVFIFTFGVSYTFISEKKKSL